MANQLDYLAWRGDLTLAQSPWCLVDSLLAANLCYNDVGPLAGTPDGMLLKELAPKLDLMQRTGNVYFEQWRTLLYRMADTVRFGEMRVHGYIDDHTDETQFSAMMLDLEDGPTIIAFRGTDTSIAGWREDCNMSFETVPAQLAATYYLENAIALTDKPVVVVGHSKGGNLAAFAAAHVSEESQRRLTSVCSFDGPGLDSDTLHSPGYNRIAPILTRMIPQGSVVGLLLGQRGKQTIVRSTAAGLIQHDSFTWQLVGTQFETMEYNTLASQVVDTTVDEWLAASTPEDRRIFVDSLFSLVEPLGAVTTDELAADKLRTATTILQASHSMKPEMRQVFHHLLGKLVTTGASNTWSALLKPIAHLIPTLTQGGQTNDA